VRGEVLRAQEGLLDLAGMHRYLAEELGVSIDLTTRSSLHPKLRNEIEQEAVQAF
jgi:hypothetical protein